MLGSADATFAYLLESFPRLLSLSVDFHMKPMVKFLEDIGIPQECMRYVLLLFPPIIFYDLETDTKPKLMALKTVYLHICTTFCVLFSLNVSFWNLLKILFCQDLCA